MTEFEFILQDRIAKIQAINEEYDLENNAYLSFSGGKDSTVLHYLIDMALPNNKIPRVFINTGIEYSDIRKFVKSIANEDDRIIIYNSNINIKEMLNKHGYPFKSKQHSERVDLYQHGSQCKSVINYLDIESDSTFLCPKKLRYQFTPEFKLKCSEKCCKYLKKNVIKRWIKENKRSITLTGMKSDEGGQRSNINCVLVKNDKLIKFHPLLVVSDEWEEEFINNYNIKLCKLYYPPFNFERTGCKGCPFNIHLQDDLDTMAKFLPNEKKQCEIIWKPVYEEYRRIGYRLRAKGGGRQTNIFDILGDEEDETTGI